MEGSQIGFSNKYPSGSLKIPILLSYDPPKFDLPGRNKCCEVKQIKEFETQKKMSPESILIDGIGMVREECPGGYTYKA